MSILTATRRVLLGRSQTYIEKVMAHGPIAYWPLNETVGTTAYCLTNGAMNGTYTGVTLASASAPGGTVCPWFDGTNDFVNVLSAALTSAFSGLEGTFMIWVKVNAAAVWTDGLERRFDTFAADGNNLVITRRSAVNDRFDWYYRANGVQNLRGNSPYSNTNWFHLALTWSDSANQVRTYLDGSEVGAAMAPDVWAGALVVALIGSADTATPPTSAMHGWLAHCALWNRAITPEEVANLYAT